MNKVIIALLLLIVGIGIFNIISTEDRATSLRIMDDMRSRQITRDSVTAAYEVALTDMTKERDSLVKNINRARVETDGTFVAVTRLAEPVVVTDSTIEEALGWLEEYNDTLY